MRELNRHGALADGRRNAFNRAGLHLEEVHVPVAGRKQRLPVPEQLRRGVRTARKLIDLGLIGCGERD